MKFGFGIGLLTIFLSLGFTSLVTNWRSFWSIPESIEQRYDQDPELIGPSSACLTSSAVFGTFFGAGDPTIDRYVWSITDASGEEVYYQTGGADRQEIEFPFTSAGTYTVSLQVIRNGDQNFYRSSQQVRVERGPRFVLRPDYVFCDNQPVQLTAIDPNEPNFANFSFEWYRNPGQVLGTGNTFTATQPGRHYVRVISQACEVTASAFVGPSIEVQVRASTQRACLGQTVNYTPDIPVLARWAYQKQGETATTSLGDSFALELNTNALDGPGLYTVFFNVDDPDRPGCSVEQRFNLEVQEGAGDFSLTKVQDSDGCEVANGAFEIAAMDAFDAIAVSDGLGTFNNLVSGDTRTVQNLAPGIYSVTGRVGNCTFTRNIQIGNSDLEEAIPFTVTANNQTCSATGINLGSLVIDFEGSVQSGRYRVISARGTEYNGAFTGETELTIDVPAGSYQVEISDGANCNSTNAVVYEVEGTGQVNFSVPPDLRVCVSYELVPDSSQELMYTLTRPDGSQVNGATGDGFVIDQSGTYRMTAVAADPASTNCPRTRTFEVEVSQPVEFEPVFQQIDCSGRQMYTAELFGRSANEVIIRWFSADGTIVGRSTQFFPPSPGNYSLGVQPRASSACEVTPIPFEVVVPLRSTEVELLATPFCDEDAFTTLTVEVAHPNEVTAIQWFVRDANGDWDWLLEFNDEQSIDVADPGMYQVVVRNPIGCRLGDAELQLERVASEEVTLEDSYFICTEDGVFPTLSPGNFSAVTWYLDGVEVSDEQTYRVTAPGNYEFMAVSELGCEQRGEFEVLETCQTLIRMPDAMIVGDAMRDFRVFANPDLDEVEVFIYQRTGELIFYRKNNVANEAEPVCTWDGVLHGKPLSVGTYPVVVRYRSERLGLEEVIKRSLVVVQ
ncbi:MAG: hypothetical protein JJU34_02870 [Lunatimonas sp.]|uniref:gliding motility-associated C-terminal domain-containing protein n=1 Tax=Lunatimonas sp. TaxID=2060141 RepID=UPI00263A8952|nr:gliding motility-associated C-terminal domain-containing protein [Lunatimonas sp.]MCC5936203.1 hypothetical protein [Lunatimonas sp.]